MLNVKQVQKSLNNICKFRKEVYLCSRLRKDGIVIEGLGEKKEIKVQKKFGIINKVFIFAVP